MFDWLRSKSLPVFATAARNWRRHDGPLASAALAFFAALSLLPVCLVLATTLGVVLRWFPAWQDSSQEVVRLIERHVSPWLAEEVARLLAEVRDRATLGGPLGVAAMAVAAIGVFLQTDALFARVWEIDRSAGMGWLSSLRYAVRERLMAFVGLLLVGGFAAVLFLGHLVLVGLRRYLLEYPGGEVAWAAAYQAAPACAAPLLLTVLYKTLPPVPVRWREALAGGVVTALAWELGRRLFEHWVVGERYSLLGLVGSFLAIMVWLYYASAAVLLGAEFVRALQESAAAENPERSPTRRGRQPRPQEP